MPSPATDLARRLARVAEAVCYHYLSNGRRQGRYWCVGDVANTPGRSLYVRLIGPEFGPGAAGKWTDAATGAHGDLLDLIAACCRHHRLAETLAEARRFLGEADKPEGMPPSPQPPGPKATPARADPVLAARRLFAMGQPIPGTLAATYLQSRGIVDPTGLPALRFHPACYHLADDASLPTAWPALLAAVTTHSGELTGLHRTWLARDGRTKAPLDTPRRAMGHLLGQGVRFGTARDVLAAGEGIETMLALRMALPGMPMIAALSANHLAALILPSGLRHLYIARDADRAGLEAAERLSARADIQGIETMTLVPQTDDFNGDLIALGLDGLAQALRPQLDPEDVARFLRPAADLPTM